MAGTAVALSIIESQIIAATNCGGLMRILLQNVRSKFYFRCGNAWTRNPRVACDFETSEALLRFVKKRDLRDVRIILRTEEPERSESVSLDSFESRL